VSFPAFRPALDISSSRYVCRPEGTVCLKDIMNNEKTNKWLKSSLEVLQYPDPSSVLPCLHSTVSEEADKCLYKLVFWLEVNKICQWDALKRHHTELSCFFRKQEQQLRLFASSNVLEKYLSECACPRQYTLRTSTPWYYEPSRRHKVIRWIVSIAIFKVYRREKAITSQKRESPLDSSNLGFTTGNDAIDRCSLRLQLAYLAKLRDLQDESNRLIREMQHLVVKAANSKKEQRINKHK
jgi:hypothetical protein